MGVLGAASLFAPADPHSKTASPHNATENQMPSTCTHQSISQCVRVLAFDTIPGIKARNQIRASDKDRQVQISTDPNRLYLVQDGGVGFIPKSHAEYTFPVPLDRRE